MTPSIEKAYNVNGFVRKRIASNVGVTASTLYNWFTARAYIPKWRRQSIERELGAAVDWSQYEREFAALNRAPNPHSPAATPAPAPAPRPRSILQEFASVFSDETESA